MFHLPGRWQRYAWIAVSVALAGVSYWMFFDNHGATGHPAAAASVVSGGNVPH
jgi:hypothetical protein